MQQIVLFTASHRKPYVKSFKIGNLLINRFAIDEDENFEILKILQLDYVNVLTRFGKNCFRALGSSHIVSRFSRI